ncbi:Sporulation-specific extracellular nuclease precursor [Bacillus cereus]|nr:Sporulation-specific extracellular nuclease precursor [Bacillus cereus]
METHQGAGCLSYREGGKGADIKYIKPADNRGAGSYIGNKVDKLPDGAKVKIVVK